MFALSRGLGRRGVALAQGIHAVQGQAAVPAGVALPCTSIGASLPLCVVPVRSLMNDFRKDFFILREPPLGPHKTLAPFFKYGGRIGEYKNYRYKVHYPEDGEYTYKPLKVTKLSGRHPETGRKVIGGVGGGSKRNARWIDNHRLPLDWDKSKELVERVIQVRYDPMRNAKIMLTGYGDRLRWQIATTTIEIGDLIRTSGVIPEVSIFPKEGDSYPLGALPNGTKICLIQPYPGADNLKIYDEKSEGIVMRKAEDGRRIVVKLNNKIDKAFLPECQCVVGKISCHPLKAIHIGSPNRMRWMGIAPRSGLWHRKEGKHGRKVKKPPPVSNSDPPEPPKTEYVLLTAMSEGNRGRMSSHSAELKGKIKFPDTVY